MPDRSHRTNDRTGPGKKRGFRYFRDLSDAVSSRLAKLAILLLIAVVLSQIALQNDTVRRWMTDVERLEGTAPE
ncbi:hypothetical protein [Paenibacillus radicis (ex Gao et al. 2016)]|uniref:Uncharacterized protein n=1 Tax=Paenibacillus radicis (ex Gao et al. 2016) TaxID=1737354 RepID=A0A917GU69_9BACL|nr:hypothetical protein [Paenibacillus radicis (ex Gao et al. 2016)]GGG57463.1 hypothetical protein GCM10010918_08160 [Paenibacillus radicis (ex Gao et al. 2016)]